jgi:SAM-dependent methyltransferase
MGGTAPARPLALHLRIFLLSVFTLALELVLIRWMSTEIRIFAYFKNLTLIACFFGLGLGCLQSAATGLAGRLRFWWTFPGLLAFCAVVSVPPRLGSELYGTVTTVLGRFNDMPIWASGAGRGSVSRFALALSLLVGLFLWITLLFVPSGQLLGRWFEEAPDKLRAYSVNVAGSLAGIAWFTLLSFGGLSPAIWFVTSLVPAIPLVGAGARERVAALACTAALGSLLLAVAPADEAVYWSPYQKLAVRPLALPRPSGGEAPGGYLIRVNETFYQRISDFRPSYLAAYADLFPEAPATDYLGYNLPYRIVGRPGRVLVVGAGTGNDVAAALRNGAGHVDAVEIDPDIVAIGRELHPERPYDDPRVTVYVDDARSFFNRAREPYDLVVFGALDSHVLSSTLSNIRLDNYVYTVESFAVVRRLLREGGLAVVVFAAQRQFILQRLSAMLARAFGHEPLLFHNREIRALGPAGGGATLLADRDGTLGGRLAADPRLAAAVLERRMALKKADVPLATDDWPYLYLEGRAIPSLYLVVMGVLVAVALLCVRPFVGALRRLDPHFFLLGAAFLLVEVQGISRMALLFGTTWLVNAIVIGAILVMILAANALAPRVRRGWLPAVYGALFVSLVASYAFPAATLLALPGTARLVLAAALLTLPVLFAGLIFVTTFARAEHAGAALGANLLGALVGGALESSSFVIGVGALGLVALALYAGSLLTLLGRGRCR